MSELHHFISSFKPVICLFYPNKQGNMKNTNFTETHRKEIGNKIVIHTELCMTKTYNNMYTHKTGLNQLVNY